MEAGGKAYIWPDDGKGMTLKNFAAKMIRNGDTLYFRPGTYQGPVVTRGDPTPKEEKIKTAVPMIKFTPERVHIRGSGSAKTIILGYIRIGKKTYS